MPRELTEELHIEKIEVEPNSYIAGKTISEIHRNKKTGALTIQIRRGSEIIDLPKNDQTIFPMDYLVIIGTDQQVRDFREAAEEKICHNKNYVPLEMELFQLTLTEGSPLVGENGNITHIREKYGILLFGLEHPDTNSLIRTTSAVTISAGDTLWIVGEKHLVENLK
jgi:CPA2 family monovalent cation:H+ antiporter-2